MLNYHTKEHDVFLAEVKISIEPMKELNTTFCTVIFFDNGQQENFIDCKWLVDTDGYFDNAKDALEELSKVKYQNRGGTET